MTAPTLKGNRTLWSLTAALLVAICAAVWLLWCPHPLKVRLSVVADSDIPEYSLPSPDATCAVIVQMENLDSNEVIFADDLKAQSKVDSHWSEAATRGLGLRLLPGTRGTLAVAAPLGTSAVRLFLSARHPALIERARWFLINKSSILESKVNWTWLHQHLPLVPGWRHAECEVSVPPSLRLPDQRHIPS